MPPKAIAGVRKAFTARGLVPTFEDNDYKNRNSSLRFDCRCGAKCVSTYRKLSLGMEPCVRCVNEKRRNTNQRRYGVNAPLQNRAIIEKARATNRERYGADSPLESEAIRSKIRDTVQARYGVDYALQNKEIRDKTKAACMMRYGVSNPTQHPHFHLKQQRSAYRLKEFQLPSGGILEFQGYEHFCLEELLAEGVCEEALLAGYKSMPAVSYTFNGKARVYHPDVFLEATEHRKARVFEVKSDWTLKADYPVLLEKLRASAALGYEVELRVYNATGTRLRSMEANAVLEAFPPAAPIPDPEMDAFIGELLAAL